MPGFYECQDNNLIQTRSRPGIGGEKAWFSKMAVRSAALIEGSHKENVCIGGLNKDKNNPELGSESCKVTLTTSVQPGEHQASGIDWNNKNKQAPEQSNGVLSRQPGFSQVQRNHSRVQQNCGDHPMHWDLCDNFWNRTHIEDVREPLRRSLESLL